MRGNEGRLKKNKGRVAGQEEKLRETETETELWIDHGGTIRRNNERRVKQREKLRGIKE